MVCLHLRGAWDKVRDDVILKFMVVAVTAYGMATFEGPMLSLKSVNAISHFTDWTIAHVHVGAFGLEWYVNLWYSVLDHSKNFQYRTVFKKTGQYSLLDWQHWVLLFYAIPMYWAGFTQSFMWKQFTEAGQLKYQFLETVNFMKPFYAVRGFGGTLVSAWRYYYGVQSYLKLLLRQSLLPMKQQKLPALEKVYTKHAGEHWHRWIERRPIHYVIAALIVILIGGAVEMIPTFMIKSNIPTIASVKPYTPLELQGRDIYVREGCYVCHSQMIRPFRCETERYGEYSKAGEFVYDHPFQWGSKRTGPDLASEGAGNNKKSNAWHFNHLDDPQSISTGSVMPAYSFLIDKFLILQPHQPK